MLAGSLGWARPFRCLEILPDPSTARNAVRVKLFSLCSVYTGTLFKPAASALPTCDTAEGGSYSVVNHHL